VRRRRRALWVAAAAWLPLAAAAGAEEPLASPPAADPPVGRVHEVRPGDTLWSIAAHSLDDPTLWVALYHANRDQIKDPTRVYPGQRLAIPMVEPAQREVLRREAEALGTP
jgi:nucleoid-associated protein YgaU